MPIYAAGSPITVYRVEDALFPTRELLPDLRTLLDEIRRRPGMYLGAKSLYALEHQLMGIQFAEEFHDVPNDKRLRGFELDAFEHWVDQTFNAERLSVRSRHFARHIAGSDAAGFDLWFEWYDRFRREIAAGPMTGVTPKICHRLCVESHPCKAGT